MSVADGEHWLRYECHMTNIIRAAQVIPFHCQKSRIFGTNSFHELFREKVTLSKDAASKNFVARKIPRELGL